MVFKRIFLIVTIIRVSACASRHATENLTKPVISDVIPKANKYENTISVCVQKYQIFLIECQRYSNVAMFKK
jgi:hypothetical protein